MSREVQARRARSKSVVQRLRAVRTYYRSIQAACLQRDRPEPGDVLILEQGDTWETGVVAGCYGLVAAVGEDALLCRIRLSSVGELEYANRLIVAPFCSLTMDMVVGREQMIIPERT